LNQTRQKIKVLVDFFLHLEGQEIFEDKFRGRQQKKFEKPCITGLPPSLLEE